MRIYAHGGPLDGFSTRLPESASSMRNREIAGGLETLGQPVRYVEREAGHFYFVENRQ